MLSPALVTQALITSTDHRPSGGYSTDTGFGEVDAAAALRAAGRLAAATPATGLAAVRFFGSPDRGSAGLRPIQVVHRNAKLIIGYSAAAYTGAVCAIIAMVLLIWMLRRSRRDRRQAPSFAPAPSQQSAFQAPPYQAPPWASAPPPVTNRDYPNTWFDPP